MVNYAPLPDQPPGGQVTNAGDIRGKRKPAENKVPKVKLGANAKSHNLDWSSADSDRWHYTAKEFNGSMSYSTKPTFQEEKHAIEEGLEKLKGDPTKYLGMFYQTSMTSWPESSQKYTLVLRTKAGGFGVKEQPGGGFTFVMASYQALPQNVEHAPDGFTESLAFQGSKGPPVCPGRGFGFADVPMIKIMDDVDPNDISQGSVGDCWLLSAISALAEFDGAIKQLFKKTPNIENLPNDEYNTYTVTLYDVTTWQPVDITVDERLCTKADGRLLGCAPTITGELWPCYLEKAVAIHCGGWDEIDGGQCTHAWRMLTGCIHQYTFKASDKGWGCFGAFNPNKNQWEKIENSPHKGFKGLWPMKWPEVGGGGALGMKVSQDDLFNRMCAWDDNNYIMGCGTKSGSDKNSTEGIVDGHAYTIIDCIDNAGGTDFDMIQVRNPWGKGEFTTGMWDDDGPGWTQYPAVKAACKPVAADDGLFWLDKGEFFKFFHTIYVCAKDMTEFLE